MIKKTKNTICHEFECRTICLITIQLHEEIKTHNKQNKVDPYDVIVVGSIVQKGYLQPTSPGCIVLYNVGFVSIMPETAAQWL